MSVFNLLPIYFATRTPVSDSSRLSLKPCRCWGAVSMAAAAWLQPSMVCGRSLWKKGPGRVWMPWQNGWSPAWTIRLIWQCELFGPWLIGAQRKYIFDHSCTFRAQDGWAIDRTWCAHAAPSQWQEEESLSEIGGGFAWLYVIYAILCTGAYGHSGRDTHWYLIDLIDKRVSCQVCVAN